MQIVKRIVEVCVVDGREFATEAAAQAYIESQAHVAEFRKFAETLQEGKSPKAVQAVVNILVKYQEWLDSKASEDAKESVTPVLSAVA